MAERIAGFLADAGWGEAARHLLAGDASNRRYERLRRPGGGGAVLMILPEAETAEAGAGRPGAPASAGPGPIHAPDLARGAAERGGGAAGQAGGAADPDGPGVAPPGDRAPTPGAEEIAAFTRIARHLAARGLSAPRILAEGEGLLLIEDLGDALFARRLTEAPGLEFQLYAAATDLLPRMQAAPPPPGLLRLDPARLGEMTGPAFDWYAPGAADPGQVAATVAELADRLLAGPAVFAHRDYHAENLIWLPELVGDARVGLIDFQDAVLAHPAYDLVSLLRDARRDVAPDLARAMTRRAVAALGAEEAGFAAAAALTGAQRNLRILGIFARLARRDGKAGYLALLPRVWAHLQADLAHPALAPLARRLAGLPAPEPRLLATLRAPAQADAGSGAPDGREGAGARRGGDASGAPSGPGALPPGGIEEAEGAGRPGQAGGAGPRAAMVFAAGFGTRMGALTRDRPKPLIEVAGRPLIDHALALVAAAGLRAVVNTHYHAGLLAAHLAGRDLAIAHEPEILDTGGGLRAALPLLGPGPVATLNSDAAWTGPNPFATLGAAWDPARMGALLLLVPLARARERRGGGDFSLDAGGRIGWGGDLIYTGTQILAPEALEGMPAGAFSLRLVWDRLIAERRAFGVVHPGLWCDVGRPEGIAAAEAMLREVGASAGEAGAAPAGAGVGDSVPPGQAHMAPPDRAPAGTAAPGPAAAPPRAG